MGGADILAGAGGGRRGRMMLMVRSAMLLGTIDSGYYFGSFS